MGLAGAGSADQDDVALLGAASIFRFGEYPIRQAKARMAAAGVPMRMD